jgi:hypothetical protein
MSDEWIFFVAMIVLAFLIFYFALKVGFSKLAVDGFNSIIIAFGGTPL